jgi:hypothetical protein
MMQKKYYFHYDFACKKVPLSLRYAKINLISMNFEFERKIFKKNKQVSN